MDFMGTLMHAVSKIEIGCHKFCLAMHDFYGLQYDFNLHL